MSSTEDNSDGILVTRGLELQWQGPSLYESQQDLDTRDRSGVTPGDGTKPLRLLRQLSPQPINGSVWLCETFDREGKAVRVVLKLFSPTLWAKPDLGYYVANNWTPETLWQRSSGPE